MVTKGAGPLPATEPSEWPHRPVYICAHPDVHTRDYEPGAPLPLDEFVEFETELFVGKMMCRLKPIPPTAPKKVQSHDDYFQNKKRHYQFVIQGHFRKEIPFSNLAIGDFYERPFHGIPKGPIMRKLLKFIETLSPGMVMDTTSDKPKVLAAFGSAQTMRVDLPGQEPDLTQPAILNNLQDNTRLLFGINIKKKSIDKTPSKRRTFLAKPKNSSRFHTNPNHVYTLELYDHAMDFANYYNHVMGLKSDVAKTMNGQAMSFGIFQKDDQAVVCKFPVWHERLLDERKREKVAEEPSVATESTTEEIPREEEEEKDSWVAEMTMNWCT